MASTSCPHEHTARISSHENLVAAERQGELTAAVYVCGSRHCCDLARAFVRSVTERGVTYYIPLTDLDED
jgi:hypothetical protein